MNVHEATALSPALTADAPWTRTMQSTAKHAANLTDDIFPLMQSPWMPMIVLRIYYQRYILVVGKEEAEVASRYHRLEVRERTASTLVTKKMADPFKGRQK
jgi:hypothetical protein